MSETTTLTYTCQICGYPNIWTRDEVLRRGTKVTYRDPHLERYTLRCKNPKEPPCTGRREVAVAREE